jgi:CRP-like cAMP-binding protein
MAGETLFFQNDPGATAFLVMGGGIRIERINEDGGRVLLNILGPGEILGETALLTGNPRMASAVAQVDSLLLCIGAPQFQKMLTLHPEMNARLMRYISERLTGVGVRLEGAGLDPLAARLGYILLDFLERFPGDAHGQIGIRLTQSDLAELALSSREHVNKVIRAWEKEGTLRMQDGRIVIVEPEQLRH